MFAFEKHESVRLVLTKEPDTDKESCVVAAGSKAEVIKGLCRLVDETAREFCMSREEILCRLAVILFGERTRREGEQNVGT